MALLYDQHRHEERPLTPDEIRKLAANAAAEEPDLNDFEEI